jgi:hypothetical protein
MTPQNQAGQRSGFGEAAPDGLAHCHFARAHKALSSTKPTTQKRTTHAWRSSHSACAIVLSGASNTNRMDGDFSHALK